MVCTKCEKKLSKLAVPDVPTSSSKQVQRTIGENRVLRGVGSSVPAKGKRFQPYAARKCMQCNSNVSQNNAKYCHNCAFKKGLCSICGKAILDTSSYTMSTK